MKLSSVFMKAIACAAALLFASASMVSAAGVGTPVDGGKVVIAMASAPGNYSPVNSDSSYGWYPIQVIFETLVRMSADGGFEPKLAEKWSVNADSTVFTFQLNKKAKWTDGVDVTSDDVAFSFWVVSNPAYQTTLRSRLMLLKGLSKTGGASTAPLNDLPFFKKIDESTFQLIADAPTDVNSILDQMGLIIRIIPKHICGSWTPEQFNKHEFWRKPTVGTGPFKFVQYKTDQYFEYVANNEYYLGKPHLEKLFIKIVSPDSVVSQLAKGEVDMTGGHVSSISSDDWDYVKSLKHLSTTSYETGSWQYMTINCSNPMFKDVRVRQAMAYAIDRDLIIKRLLKGEAVKAYSNIVPGNYYYDPKVEGRYPYDAEKAKQLLKDAGWDFSKKVVLHTPLGVKFREQSADIIQSNFKDIGIQVEVRKMDFATFIADVRKGSYELALLGWTSTLDPDARTQFGSKDSFSKSSFKDLDDLMEQGASTADPAKRRVIYNKYQSLFLDNLPVVPLYRPRGLQAYNSKVNGVTYLLTEWGTLRNTEEWWVSK